MNEVKDDKTMPKFPWNKPQGFASDVQDFIDRFKNCLEPHQVEMLNHFKDNIYGFRIDEFTDAYYDSFGIIKRKAIFRFSHPDVEGEIKIEF